MFKIFNFLAIAVLSFSNHAYAIKIGVTSGPHAIIMEEVKKEALKNNLNINIVEFNDFILPNASLADKSIDANSYQHQPFLDEEVKNKGYKIVSVAKTILLPLGIYSLKHKTLDVNEGSRISIPNDPTNAGRALLLLQKAKLIELKSNNNPTILDISANPKKLKIIEIEAPQIARTLDDVDYGITNTDWIVLAKMKLDSVFKEDTESPYVNVIAVRTEDKDNNDIKKLIEIYHSKHIRDFIIDKFNGAVLPIMD